MRIIGSSSVNIIKYYNKNGNLDGLNVKGIGKKIRGDLQEILRRNGKERN